MKQYEISAEVYFPMWGRRVIDTVYAENEKDALQQVEHECDFDNEDVFVREVK